MCMRSSVNKKPTTQGANLEAFQEIWPISLVFVIFHFCFSWLAYAVETGKCSFSLMGILTRWDAFHYLDIAERGYIGHGSIREMSQIAFPPFYSIIFRLFSVVFQSRVLSALIVANLAYFAATFLLYRLVRLDYDRAVARRAVLWLSVFPTSYFLHVPYTESLFVALVLASFFFARQDKWWLAGVMGLLAGMTRLQGLVLGLGLLTEYIFQKGLEYRRWDRRIVAATIPCGASLIYLGLNFRLFGNPFEFVKLHQQNWGKISAPPWTGLADALHRFFFNAKDPWTYAASELVAAAVGFILVCWIAKNMRRSYAVYSVLSLLVVFSWNFWMSTPRHLLGIFPLFIALALLFKKPASFYVASVFSILLQALLLSQFVQGRWAF